MFKISYNYIIKIIIASHNENTILQTINQINGN